MRIGLVSREYVGSYRAGGIATYISVLASCLADAGHKVYIISANDYVADNQIIRRGSGTLELRLSGGDFPDILKRHVFSHKMRKYYISYRW